MERLLEKLEIHDPQTSRSPHIAGYTPGTPRAHRSPHAGKKKMDIGIHHGYQPNTLVQLATNNIGATINSMTNKVDTDREIDNYNHDHHVAKQSLTKSLASMSTLVGRLHAAKNKGENKVKPDSNSKLLDEFMSSPVSDDGGNV